MSLGRGGPVSFLTFITKKGEVKTSLVSATDCSLDFFSLSLSLSLFSLIFTHSSFTFYVSLPLPRSVCMFVFVIVYLCFLISHSFFFLTPRNLSLRFSLFLCLSGFCLSSVYLQLFLFHSLSFHSVCDSLSLPSFSSIFTFLICLSFCQFCYSSCICKVI